MLRDLTLSPTTTRMELIVLFVWRQPPCLADSVLLKFLLPDYDVTEQLCGVRRHMRNSVNIIPRLFLLVFLYASQQHSHKNHKLFVYIRNVDKKGEIAGGKYGS